MGLRRRRQRPEEAFQRQVIQLAKLLGWRVAHFRTVAIAKPDGSVRYATPVQADGAGFPDLILIKGRRLVVWELKIPPNTVTPEQIEWLLAFRAAGAQAGVMTPEDWPLIEETLRAA